MADFASKAVRGGGEASLMAWTSDTIWCDPKFADLSSDAFKAYICANSYSAGFLLRGHLTAGQLRTIGARAAVRRELIAARLWHDDGSGGVHINDWDEHNAKRDERRVRDRERKRKARLSAGTSAGQSAGRSAGTASGASRRTSTVAAHVEGSEEEPTSSSKNEEEVGANKPGQALVVAGTSSAQQLVAHYVDESRKLGSDPPARVKGQIAQQVGGLLAEGFSGERVQAGLDLLLERRLNPSVLSSAVHEAALPPAGRRDGRKVVTPEQMHKRALELEREGR